MSKSEVERFAGDLGNNPALWAEARKVDRLAALVDLGDLHGYSFTLAEVRAYFRARAARPLSDAELDTAGGIDWPGLDAAKFYPSGRAAGGGAE